MADQLEFVGVNQKAAEGGDAGYNEGGLTLPETHANQIAFVRRDYSCSDSV